MIYKMLINNNVGDNIWSLSLTQLSNTLSVVGLLEPCYLAESEGRPGRTFINFFCNFFLSKSTQEGRGDKKWSDNSNTCTHTKKQVLLHQNWALLLYWHTNTTKTLCDMCFTYSHAKKRKTRKNREKGVARTAKFINTATTVVIQNIS